eukprot:2407702-Amphidinium_carterae.2
MPRVVWSDGDGCELWIDVVLMHLSTAFTKRGQEKWGNRAGRSQILPHHVIISTSNINENKASAEVPILSRSQRLRQEVLWRASPTRTTRAELMNVACEDGNCGCTAHGVVNPTINRNGVDSCRDRWCKQLVASLPEIGPCDVRRSFVWG